MSKRNGSKNLFSFSFLALLMSLGTLVSRLLGFIRDLGIAAFFSRTQTDIFFVAFRLPNFFRRLLGEGSFSASVTPQLVESLEQKNGKQKAGDLSSSLFTLIFLTASLLSLLGVVFMEDLMGLFFKNTAYSTVEGKLELTVLAGKLVFSYLFLTALYSYFMSVAHAFGKFFLPALAPALFNLIMIVFAFLPQNWWPFPAFGLSLAVLAGGILQLFLTMIVIYKLGFWPVFSFKFFKEKAVLSFLKRFVPVSIGLSGLALIGFLNLYFAGWLPEGAHTYIYYGDRLLEFPRSLIAVSIGTALIPELSRFYVQNDKKNFFRLSSHSLDFLLFLTLPSACVFFFLSEPLISLLFERGQFDKESVSQTALVLKINALVLVFSSASRVLVSGFFAANKNWSCAFCNFIYVLFHAICAWFLTSAYNLTGLVSATALSSFFYFFLLFAAFSYLIGPLNFWERIINITKTLPGLFVLMIGVYGYEPVFSFFGFYVSFAYSQFLALFCVFVFGGTGYIVFGLILKHPCALETVNLFKNWPR